MDHLYSWHNQAPLNHLRLYVEEQLEIEIEKEGEWRREKWENEQIKRVERWGKMRGSEDKKIERGKEGKNENRIYGVKREWSYYHKKMSKRKRILSVMQYCTVQHSFSSHKRIPRFSFLLLFTFYLPYGIFYSNQIRMQLHQD